ncbi:hypothetical protein [Paenibacillus sp. NEAU-GSW1]|uniref:hypothetical protein n=1 Tax=Paenibacillus sp. NEAU-GSW1 TaxID=2682486 RepID=UPI0012E193F4|nr:hypothetical protein [Paenibacillus sp. NEAU-GSW1]MUT68502.1 hypothetical protein [Paenibacillus sp. NEAU-GSW1]
MQHGLRNTATLHAQRGKLLNQIYTVETLLMALQTAVTKEQDCLDLETVREVVDPILELETDIKNELLELEQIGKQLSAKRAADAVAKGI